MCWHSSDPGDSVVNTRASPAACDACIMHVCVCLLSVLPTERMVLEGRHFCELATPQVVVPRSVAS